MSLGDKLSKEGIKFQIITEPPKPVADDIERCIQRKMATGKTRAEARRECIEEKKLHGGEFEDFIENADEFIEGEPDGDIV